MNPSHGVCSVDTVAGLRRRALIGQLRACGDCLPGEEDVRAAVSPGGELQHLFRPISPYFLSLQALYSGYTGLESIFFRVNSRGDFTRIQCLAQGIFVFLYRSSGSDIWIFLGWTVV